jgi:4-oxalomesaconate hydratase
MGDYPGVRNGQDLVEPVNAFREHRPAIVLTHGFEDPYHMDHQPANQGTLEARMCAEESGYPAEGKGSRDEPRHSSSSSRTIPGNAISGRRCRLKSRRSGSASAMAMESMAAQQRLVKYCTVAGERRAVERVSDSGKRHTQYAEVFERIYPRVTDRLS